MKNMWESESELELTLQVCVEPFGLGGPDVASPPPRVGVARCPLQHLDMNRPELRRSAIDRIGSDSDPLLRLPYLIPVLMLLILVD